MGKSGKEYRFKNQNKSNNKRRWLYENVKEYKKNNQKAA